MGLSNLLGHGRNSSLFSELTSSNAYLVVARQIAGVIVRSEANRETLTLFVADDRNAGSCRSVHKNWRTNIYNHGRYVQ